MITDRITLRVGELIFLESGSYLVETPPKLYVVIKDIHDDQIHYSQHRWMDLVFRDLEAEGYIKNIPYTAVHRASEPSVRNLKTR